MLRRYKIERLSARAIASSHYSDKEREFLQAIDHYKRTKQRPFPTWREVLHVLRQLGWRKLPPVGQKRAPKSSPAVARAS